MTKKNIIPLIVSLITVGALFFLKKNIEELKKIEQTNAPVKLKSTGQQPKTPPTHLPEETSPKKESPEIEEASETQQTNKPTNRVTTYWQQRLIRSLKTQGGESVKSVKVNKIKSLIWTEDRVSLHAESVVITLKDDNGHESTFRALVDSQTGKILKTWDQPVFDPASPKDNFKIKLDPRYHNE